MNNCQNCRFFYSKTDEEISKFKENILKPYEPESYTTKKYIFFGPKVEKIYQWVPDSLQVGSDNIAIARYSQAYCLRFPQKIKVKKNHTCGEFVELLEGES